MEEKRGLTGEERDQMVQEILRETLPEEFREIRTVAIMGVGAVGSYFIYGLSEKLGENLWVVAEGERRDRLMKNGLTINGEHYDLNVKTPEEAHGADLLLVAVKYGALEEALPQIKKVVGEDTIVASLLNGVDSEEIIGWHIGISHMVYSYMKISSERRQDGVHFNPEGTPGMFIGMPGYEKPTKNVQAVIDLIKDSKAHIHFRKDIISEIWRKYDLNMTYNIIQAILQVPVGAYVDSKHVEFLAQQMHREVREVAQAQGIEVPEEMQIALGNKLTRKNARYSTLQDIDAGRKTEIEMFCGTLMRLGDQLDVPVPFSTFCYHAVRALEEKNRGLFNYED